MTDAVDFNNGHALLIAGNFDSDDVTTKDVQEMYAVLTDDKRCAYPEANVTRKLPGEVTRAVFLDALHQLANQTNQNSTVIVFYSGHGRVASNDVFFLLPAKAPANVDAETLDPDQLKTFGIAGDELSQAIATIQARKLLLILDCCHAGAADLQKASLHDATHSAAAEAEPAADPQDTGWGRVVLASSLPGELSFGGSETSTFTRAVIEGLEGQGSSTDGFVYLTDLIRYACNKVAKDSENGQNPMFISTGSTDFPIARYPKEPPSRDAKQLAHGTQ